MKSPIIYICNGCGNQTFILSHKCTICGFSGFSQFSGNQKVQYQPNFPPMETKPFACQNCLYELGYQTPTCPACHEPQTIILKNQIPFFASGQNQPKPNLLYCKRCKFKTVRALTDCPRCTSGLKKVLYGPTSSRLITKKNANNFEIFAGVLLMLFGLLAVPLMILVFYTNSGNPKSGVEIILIGVAGVGIIFFGIIVLINGIVGRMKGGR